MIYKIEAQDDTVYVMAPCEADALTVLRHKIGDIPDELLMISAVDVLPKGEELL